MHLSRSKRFEKQFKKLPKKIRERATERLLCFVADPYDPVLENHPLSGEFQGRRSINITGDVRAIYRELEAGKAYFVLIGTHHELYGS